MELLDSTRNADLLYALYGLLMFLPQCHAFHCLKDRLACLPPENVVKLNRYSNDSKSFTLYYQVSYNILYSSALEQFIDAKEIFLVVTARQD